MTVFIPNWEVPLGPPRAPFCSTVHYVLSSVLSRFDVVKAISGWFIDRSFSGIITMVSLTRKQPRYIHLTHEPFSQNKWFNLTSSLTIFQISLTLIWHSDMPSPRKCPHVNVRGSVFLLHFSRCDWDRCTSKFGPLNSVFSWLELRIELQICSFSDLVMLRICSFVI